MEKRSRVPYGSSSSSFRNPARHLHRILRSTLQDTAGGPICRIGDSPLRILIASPIDPDAIAALQERHDVRVAHITSPDALRDAIADCEVLVFRSGLTLDRETLHGAPNLGLIVRAGCGLDNIDLEYVGQRGIRLERIPQPAAIGVAELAIGMMIGLARRIGQADAKLRQGHWTKHELGGVLLHDKTLGIVGAGNIGSRVGQLGAAFGMRVLGCVDAMNPRVSSALAAKGIQLVTFEQVIGEADFVSVHVPLLPTTRNLIDAAVIARMKRGAILVNLSRGGVVDEAAVYDALVQSHLQGAGMDVHAEEGEGKISPLASLRNVVLTPHIGAQTLETQRDIGRRALAIISSFEHSSMSATLAASSALD